MSLWITLRLGLRQFAAGLLSVRALGILNRVMRVEMGLDLTLVSVVVSAHYFVAPLTVPLGHRSDTHPYFGYHRTPYILAGVRALPELRNNWERVSPVRPLLLNPSVGQPV